MKKFLKILSALFCLSLLTVAGLIAYAINSSVFQTNQANKYLRTFAVGANVDKLNISLNTIIIEGLNLPLTSAEVKIEYLKIKYNWKALLFNEIIIYDLDSDSITVNLPEAPAQIEEKVVEEPAIEESQKPIQRNTSYVYAPSKPETKKEESNNFLQKYSLRIDKANLEVLLQKKDVKNTINISLKKYLSKSILLPTQGELSCNLKSDLTSSAIDFIATLEAKNSQNVLEAILTENTSKILQCSAIFDKDFSKFDAKVRLDFSNKNFQNFVPSTANAPFNGTLFADLTADTSIENIDCNLTFTFTSGDLTALNQSLSGLENLNAQGQMAFNRKSNIVNIDAFKIDILQNSHLVLNALIKEKILIDLENPFAIPNGELLVLNIAKIPEGILKSYLPDFRFSPNKFSTSISLSKVENKDAFLIQSIRPLEFNSMNIFKNDSLFIKNLNSNFHFDILIEKASKISADLKLDFLEDNAPALTLNSKILFDNDNISSDIALIGNLKTALDLQVQSLNYSKYFKGTKIDLTSKISLVENLINIATFDTKISDANDAIILSAFTTGAMSYDLKNKSFDAKSNQAKLLAKDTPFAIISTFIPNASGEILNCDITLNNKESNLIINGFASIKNLSYIHNGESIVKRVTPYINFDAVLENKSLDLNVSEFILSQNNIQAIKGTALAKCSFEEYFVLQHAKIAFITSLPALMNLECLNKYNNISSGHAEGLIILNENKCEASGKISNFSTRTRPEKLEVFNFSLQATKNDVLYDILSDIEIFSSRGKSQANGDFKLRENFDINLTVDNIVLEDITLLSKAFSKPTVNYQKTIAPTSASNSGVNRNIQKEPENEHIVTATISTDNDAKAFWNFGRNLDFVCNIKSIQNKGEFLLKNFSGKLNAEENLLSIENVKGLLYEGKLEMTGKCIFDANAKVPYLMENAKITIDKINLEPLTKNQNGESMISGLFDGSANIKSSGTNIDTLLNNIKGNAEFKSANKGVLSLINQTSVTGATVGTANAVLGIGEKLLGNKVKEVGAMSELLRIFQALEYSSLSAKASRADDMDIKIEKIEMISQDIIISGAGKILHSKNLPITKQDLSINAEVFVSEKTIAPLFKSAGLLRDGMLIEGFATGPKFIMGGNLSSPTNNLTQILRTASTGTVNSLLQKLQNN